MNKTIIITALILTAIGAINWGLTVAGTNLVSDLMPKGLHKILFALIGVAGLITLYYTIQHFMMKKEEEKSLSSSSSSSSSI
jgi:uncharacterized membrane protein YuzA (DUF378 family)